MRRETKRYRFAHYNPTHSFNISQCSMHWRVPACELSQDHLRYEAQHKDAHDIGEGGQGW